MFTVARGQFGAKPLRRTGLTTARSTPCSGTAPPQPMYCLGRLSYPRLHAAKGWLVWLPRGPIRVETPVMIRRPSGVESPGRLSSAKQAVPEMNGTT